MMDEQEFLPHRRRRTFHHPQGRLGRISSSSGAAHRGLGKFWIAVGRQSGRSASFWELQVWKTLRLDRRDGLKGRCCANVARSDLGCASSRAGESHLTGRMDVNGHRDKRVGGIKFGQGVDEAAVC